MEQSSESGICFLQVFHLWLGPSWFKLTWLVALVAGVGGWLICSDCLTRSSKSVLSSLIGSFVWLKKYLPMSVKTIEQIDIEIVDTLSQQLALEHTPDGFASPFETASLVQTRFVKIKWQGAHVTTDVSTDACTDVYQYEPCALCVVVRCLDSDSDICTVVPGSKVWRSPAGKKRAHCHGLWRSSQAERLYSRCCGRRRAVVVLVATAGILSWTSIAKSCIAP